ncbi:liprin-beta homolog isoform X3 [Symsagittifera roscoffensis]|uniref:liprin-beta homolog isoform X3 n=1 Tax=Symsagittifera roscoffensis TaxID=84072 RepID=UPI00307C64D5
MVEQIGGPLGGVSFIQHHLPQPQNIQNSPTEETTNNNNNNNSSNGDHHTYSSINNNSNSYNSSSSVSNSNNITRPLDLQERPNNLLLSSASRGQSCDELQSSSCGGSADLLGNNTNNRLGGFSFPPTSATPEPPSSLHSSQRNMNNNNSSSNSHSTSPLVRCYSQSQADTMGAQHLNGFQTEGNPQSNGSGGGGGGEGGYGADDMQERIDLLEREKKVLQYHNQFLKEELESHKKQIAELHTTVADLRKRNIRYQNILTSYEQITAAGFNNLDKSKTNANVMFQNQSQSLTSDDDNMSEKALTPTSSTGTESDSAKSIQPHHSSHPHPTHQQQQQHPNLQIPSSTLTSNNCNRQTTGAVDPKRSPVVGGVGEWDYRPPEFSFAPTDHRPLPSERPSPLSHHTRQRSLQYCHSNSPIVGGSQNNTIKQSGRPSSPLVGGYPRGGSHNNDEADDVQFSVGGARPPSDAPFRSLSNAGNARMNSLGGGHVATGTPMTPQHPISSSATLNSRASSCNERKVAPGPPPRTSALSKLDNRNDKCCSVPNLNVYVNSSDQRQQTQLQSQNQGYNHSRNKDSLESQTKPGPLKRNNSLIRLFSRKSSTGQQFSNKNKDPGSPMKRGQPRQNSLGGGMYGGGGGGGSETSTPNLNSSRHNSISSHTSLADSHQVPFQQWDRLMVASWLERLGLGQYVGSLSSSATGASLVSAGPHHFEKLLGMKNHLHRKKLMLAMRSQLSPRPNPVDHIDHQWVIRWLDDIGLPQHKEAFAEAKIDGRVLYYLTFDDLVSLKVFSALHQISIGRAVQCLRTQQWNPHCLVRRPHPQQSQPPHPPPSPSPGIMGSGVGEDGGMDHGLQMHPLPMDQSGQPSGHGSGFQEDLMLWTNHRIMDWLRSIDLSEYAPNLRGSGVHGGLMSLEPRFVGETLADVLCIPNSKTLLRRHLITQFNRLVGAPCEELKRMVEMPLPTPFPQHEGEVSPSQGKG